MKNKRVIVSLAMLLVSAIMLSTASFAWFSMNTDVKVEGIEFVAYSDSLFLEISKDNQTFAPNDIHADIAKQYLRPIAYGTIEDMGGAYTITPTPAAGRFDPDAGKLYYREVRKAESNDTYYVPGVDYYCVNEELRGPSSTEGYYIEGENQGVDFVIITGESAPSNDVFERVGNNYIAKTLENGESAYGYYTVVVGGACGAGETYSPANVYYEHRDGNWYVVGGLDEGSHLEGYVTLDVQPESAPGAGNLYWLKSVDNENDQYSDYVSFVTAQDYAGTKLVPEQGYWYRGYSESLVTEYPNADGQSGRINGVINDTYPTDQSTPYYLYTTYYLRMAQASNLASNLRINSVEVIGSEVENSLTNAVRVMLVVTSSIQDEVVRITYNNRTGEFMRETKDGRQHTDTTLFFERFLGDQEEVVTVEVYMYYDGTDEAVNTNYTLDFSGHTVNLEFGIDTPDYLK